MKQMRLVAALAVAACLALIGASLPGQAPRPAASLKAQLTLPFGPVTSLSVSRDGKFVAAAGGSIAVTGGFSRLVKVYDVAAGEAVTLTRHTHSARCVALSGDSKALAIGNRDGTITLRELPSRKEGATLKGHTGDVTALAISPDGKLLASAGGRATVRLWDLATGAQKADWGGHSKLVSALLFSRDGKLLVSAGGRDQTVRLWDVAAGKEKTTLTGFESAVDEVALSGDGKLLATKTSFGTVKLWHVGGGKEEVLRPGSLNDPGDGGGLAFSGDGRTLAWARSKQVETDRWEGGVALWDVAAGKQKPMLRQAGVVRAVAFSPDGKLLAAGGDDGGVTLWDVAAGKRNATLKGHTQRADSLAFSGDGKLLASGGWDGAVKLWAIP